MKTTSTLSAGLYVTLVFFTGMITGFASDLRSGTIGVDPQLVRDAVFGDGETAQRAIAALRDKGEPGLDALFDAYAGDIQKILNAPAGSKDAGWPQLSAALDAVGQQRDCFASRLYWHTDLERAKAEARKSGKPILSLRLLGKLNEEYSCANSRFFRTVLYANTEVSRRLREHFVLHWQSVRPAPKVSIDFGDGRTLERTITGNSIHYILDSEGGVVDALPGLYGPQAFLRALAVGEEAAIASAKQAPAEREEFLREFHRARLADNVSRWNDDLIKIGSTVPLRQLANNPSASALAADKRTIAKSEAERPIVRAVAPTRELLAQATEDALWPRIAALHAADSRLDRGSRTLIQIKNPTALDAGRLATSKAVVENPLMRAVRNLERSTAEDTARNEYLFHTTIHEWFVTGSAPSDLDRLNEKVYAELFLTPGNDPWLGLMPADVYSALDNNGVATSTREAVTK